MGGDAVTRARAQRFMRVRIAVIAAVIMLAAVYGLWRLSALPCFQLVGEVHCRVETDQPMVALTFDDGPVAPGVEMVLPILAEHGAPATFFLVGQAMERNPGLARRLLDAGHELGNHSYSHAHLLGHLPSRYRQEVGDTDALLRVEGEEHPRLFRPPYGKRLIGLPMAVRDADYITVMWDVEEAYGETDPQRYADFILGQVRPGSIVLMHPMFGHREVISKALPIILDGLAARGLQPVTVSQLLSLEGKSSDE